MAYGAILGQTLSSGEKVCRFVIGTSTAGWTENDCDYLCDGIADQTEINAAIDALPSTGGEIVILDGTYNISSSGINISNKENVKINGNGSSTILKRSGSSGYYIVNLGTKSYIENILLDSNNSSYSTNGGIIKINGSNTIINNIYAINNPNCDDVSINGELSYIIITNSNFKSRVDLRGKVDNAIISKNTFMEFNFSNLIKSTISNNVGIINGNNGVAEYVTITGNICNSGTDSGIKVPEFNYSVISNNICCNNSNYGIETVSNGANQSSIIGNVCNGNGKSGIFANLVNFSSINGNTCNSNNIGIEVLGSMTTSLTGFASNVTGNTCYNNEEGGMYCARMYSSSITGNVFIRGTGQASDYSSSQYTILLNSGQNNIITGNNIMGKNYTDNGSNNTWANNKYN